MSRDGSGNYSLPAGNPVVYGTAITDTWANTTLDDIASALTASLTADGQTAVTGDLDFGANKITNIGSASSDTDVPQFGQLPHKNRLINSGFVINQRSYSSGSGLSAGAFGHDRWKAGASGCTYTFTQVYPYTTITITAGTLKQIIRAENMEAGSYVLSWTGTATARINTGSYGSSPLTVTGLSSGTQCTIEFATGTVSKPQFEPGGTATQIEFLPMEITFSQCEAYYQLGSGTKGTGTFYFGSVASGTNYSARAQFRQIMIAIPTVTLSNGSNSNFGPDPGSPDNAHPRGFTETRTATFSANSAIFTSNYVADAEL